MSQVRNQVQSVTMADLLGSQLADIGGKMYASAEDSQSDLLTLVQSWRSIHAPAYGQPIPSSGVGASVVDNETTPVSIISPGVNETVTISALAIVNNGASPANVTITVGSATWFSGDVPPAFTQIVIGVSNDKAVGPLTVVKGQEVEFTQTGAGQGTVSVEYAYHLTVQG